MGWKLILPTNHYFNTTHSKTEQSLVEDLIVESIQIAGTEAFYLPRNDQNTDLIYGEDPLKSFTSNYPIEIYNKDTNEFEGQKEMFSKFGIDIQNDYTILLSRRTFKQRVLAQNPLYDRPKEGDLIYIPHVSRGGTLFEITFAEPDADFFMLGRKLPYYYELKLAPFKYSNELLQTGIDDIDTIIQKDAYNLQFILTPGGIGDFVLNEYVYQGNNLETATSSALVTAWDAYNGFLNVAEIKNKFEVGFNIIGSKSGAVWNLLTFDELQDNYISDAFDNKITSIEGNNYLDNSETNPLTNI